MVMEQFQIKKLYQASKIEIEDNSPLVLVYAPRDIFLMDGGAQLVPLGIAISIIDADYIQFHNITERVLVNDVYIHPASMKIYPRNNGEFFEICVILKNDGDEDYIIRRGEPLVKISCHKDNMILPTLGVD